LVGGSLAEIVRRVRVLQEGVGAAVSQGWAPKLWTVP